MLSKEVIEARKKELMDTLKSVDSVLETNGVDAYEEYGRLGGELLDAQEWMCNNFEGIGGIANKLASWVEVAGGKPDTVIEKVIGAHLTNGSFQTKLADQAFVNMTEAESQALPALLNGIARSDKWWPYVKKLVAKGGVSSPLLEALRQHHSINDPAVAGAHTPARCLEVIKKTLEALMIKPVLRDADIREFYDASMAAATYDELTLVIWLRVLNEVSQDAKDEGFKVMLRRCMQDIRAKAVERAIEVGNASEYDALSLVTRLGILIDTHSAGVAVPERVMNDLWVLISVKDDEKRPGSTTGVVPPALQNINGLFAPLRPEKCLGTDNEVVVEDDAVVEVSKIPNKARTAYLEMLCRPEVMKCIWKKLFVQSVRAPHVDSAIKADVNEDVRNCLCMLLSLATVFLRHKNDKASQREGGTLSLPLPIERLNERKEARKLEDNLLACVAVCEHLHPACRVRFFEDPFTNAFPAASVKAGTKALSCRVRLREGISESSVIAYGIVLWARDGLLTKIDLSKLLKSCVIYLELLEVVAEKYPLWREEIISLYADAYAHQIWPNKDDPHRNHAREMKLRGYYGNALQSMVRLRCATRVVNLYRERFAENDIIDAADVRTFVCGLVSLVNGQCSSTFGTALLRLLATPRVARVFAHKPTVLSALKMWTEGKTRIQHLLSEMTPPTTADRDPSLDDSDGATLLQNVKNLYGVA